MRLENITDTIPLNQNNRGIVIVILLGRARELAIDTNRYPTVVS